MNHFQRVLFVPQRPLCGWVLVQLSIREGAGCGTIRGSILANETWPLVFFFAFLWTQWTHLLDHWTHLTGLEKSPRPEAAQERAEQLLLLDPTSRRARLGLAAAKETPGLDRRTGLGFWGAPRLGTKGEEGSQKETKQFVVPWILTYVSQRGLN